MLIGTTKRSQLPGQWVGILDGIFAITLTLLGITLPDYTQEALSHGLTLRSGALIFLGLLRFWIVFLVLYDIWHISRQCLVHALTVGGRSHNFYGLLFLLVTILPVLVSVRGNLLMESVHKGASLASRLSFFRFNYLPSASTVFVDILTLLVVCLSYWMVYLNSLEHQSHLLLGSPNDHPHHKESRHFFSLHRSACSLRLLLALSLLAFFILQMPFQGFPLIRLCMIFIELIIALLLVSPVFPSFLPRLGQLLSSLTR
jgi:uncharacterized membrane protein